MYMIKISKTYYLNDHFKTNTKKKPAQSFAKSKTPIKKKSKMLILITFDKQNELHWDDIKNIRHGLYHFRLLLSSSLTSYISSRDATHVS